MNILRLMFKNNIKSVTINWYEYYKIDMQLLSQYKLNEITLWIFKSFNMCRWVLVLSGSIRFDHRVMNIQIQTTQFITQALLWRNPIPIFDFSCSEAIAFQFHQSCVCFGYIGFMVMFIKINPYPRENNFSN